MKALECLNSQSIPLPKWGLQGAFTSFAHVQLLDFADIVQLLWIPDLLDFSPCHMSLLFYKFLLHNYKFPDNHYLFSFYMFFARLVALFSIHHLLCWDFYFDSYVFLVQVLSWIFSSDGVEKWYYLSSLNSQNFSSNSKMSGNLIGHRIVCWQSFSLSPLFSSIFQLQVWW